MSFSRGTQVIYLPDAPGCDSVRGVVQGQDRDGKLRVKSPEWDYSQRIRPQNLVEYSPPNLN